MPLAVHLINFLLLRTTLLCLSALQPSGGPYLGLEPGLGLTTPLLDHHKRDKAAGEGPLAAGTPNSLAGSEAARPFGRVPPSPTAGPAAGEDAEAAVAAAAAATAAGAAAAAADTKKGAVQMQVVGEGCLGISLRVICTPVHPCASSTLIVSCQKRVMDGLSWGSSTRPVVTSAG